MKVGVFIHIIDGTPYAVKVARTVWTYTKTKRLVRDGEEPGDPEDPVVDKAALVAKLDEVAALNEEDYTEETWTDLVTAKTAAEDVVAKEDATQDEVDAALTALNNAVAALVEVEDEEPEPEPVTYTVEDIQDNAVSSVGGAGGMLGWMVRFDESNLSEAFPDEFPDTDNNAKFEITVDGVSYEIAYYEVDGSYRNTQVIYSLNGEAGIYAAVVTVK